MKHAGGRPKATQCVHGHDTTSPDSRASKGYCKVCSHIKDVARRSSTRRKEQQSTRRKARRSTSEGKIQDRAYNKRYRDTPKGQAAHARRRTRKSGAGGSYTGEQAQILKDFYNNRCICCWKTNEELLADGLMLVMDHVLPVAKGGTGWIFNMQPLCHHKFKGATGGCNVRKNDSDTDYRIVNLLGLS